MRDVLILLLGCCYFVPASYAIETIQVRTALLDEIASYPERSAPATVVSLNAATISAELPARVIELPVRIGDIVQAGGILARLDCTDYILAERRALASIDSITARMDLARKRLDRTRTLRSQNSVAEEALDERVSELAILEAEQSAAVAAVDTSRANLARCEIKSPFTALVTERSSAVGEFASPGMPLLKILDIVAIEISAQVAVNQVSQIESAAQIDFTYSDHRYPVHLRTILPAINPDTRNQEVRLEFSENSAIAGAAGKLVWLDPQPHIPANLVVERGGGLGVFVLKNDTAVFHPLPVAQPGRSSAVNLPGDTRLVIEGQFSLQDQVKVQVNN